MSSELPTGDLPPIQNDTDGSTFKFKEMLNFVSKGMNRVKDLLSKLDENQSEVDIALMFQIQMEMNKLNQLLETASSMMSAAHNAASTCARKTGGN